MRLRTMPPRKNQPNKLPKSVKSAVRKATRKAAPDGRRAPVDRNDYLASLLHPELNGGARIPDECCIPSSTFTTQHVISIDTDIAGNGYYVFCPRFTTSGAETTDDSRCSALKIGINAAGDLTLMTQDSPDLPASYTGCGPMTIMSSKARSEITSVYASVRPVSSCISVVCTEAAMTAEGTYCTGLFPRGQLPARVNPVGVAGGAGIMLGAGNGPATLSEIFDSPLVTTSNTQQSACVHWFPQDSNDFDYAATVYGTTSSAAFWKSGWAAIEPTATNNYWLPFQVVDVEDSSGYARLRDLDGEQSAPYIVLALQGFSSDTQGVLTCTLTINWEALPLATETRVVAVAPSPSNPNELAQAANVVQMLPSTTQPSVPSSPANAVYAKADAATTHLYDPKVSTKKAVEGTSFWTGVKDFFSKNASSLLTGGVSLIKALL